jgi:tetratricopeptide (TPR) repeat protein
MRSVAQDDLPEWVSRLASEPSEIYSLLDGSSRPPTGDIASSLQGLSDWLGWLNDPHVINSVIDNLVNWIEARWGCWLPTDEIGAARVARGWIAISDLAVLWPEADALRAALRSHVNERGWYLGKVSTGPHLDALASYLIAIATRQPDAQLAPLWWRILGLPDSVPVRHLVCGVIGVQQLPVDDPNVRGRFDPKVVRSLVLAGESLARATEEGRVSPELAKRMFFRLGRRLRAQYPQISWWQPHLEPDDGIGLVRSWLEELFPELGAGVGSELHGRDDLDRAQSKVAGRDADLAGWRAQATELRAAVHSGLDAGTKRRIEVLLNEQRSHAERTGESHPLTQTLCNFSSGVRTAEPSLAVELAREAVSWEAWESYAWTALVRAIQALRGTSVSLRTAFEATERVPDSQPVVHLLGEHLLELRCRAQAEEVFRVAFDRFGDPRDATALGYLFLGEGDYLRAEEHFGKVLEQAEFDSRALRGMARALQLSDRGDDGVQLLSTALPTVTRKDAPFVWAAYVAALKFVGRETESEEASAEARSKGIALSGDAVWNPPPHDSARLFVASDDRVVLLGQARLLRRAARRGSSEAARCASAAQELLDDAPAKIGWDDVVAATSARLAADCDRFGEAEEQTRTDLERAPGSLPLWSALAQIGVERARTEGASFSNERLSELRLPYRELVELNTATRPIYDLGFTRGALSLHDGRAADKQAHRALEVLVDWRDESGDRRTRGWWQAQARAALLGGDAGKNEEADFDLDAVRQRANDYAEQLSDLEEDFVLYAVA